MSYVTILWSGAAAAALLLGIVHATVWLVNRQAWSNLALAVLALSLSGIGVTELGMMVARSPEEWGEWVRWCHLPLFLHIVAIVLFVRLYLGTGRLWLMWTIIGLRTVILIINFSSYPNVNFESIASVARMHFLGEEITVVGQGVVSQWQWLATLNTVLLTIFVVDAAIALWRQGAREARRRALFVGGGILLFVVVSIASTQVVIWGLVVMPMMITPPFLISLAAMAYEMTRDTLRAGRLASDLQESENRLELAANAAGLGLGGWDAKNTQLWATQRSRSLFGFEPDEAIDVERVAGRIHREDYPRVRDALMSSIATRSHFQVQFRICAPHIPVRWMASHGDVVVDAHGRLSKFRGVLKDVSEQKQAQEEAEELRRELTHAGRVTMLGQLASALAHELSQPLGAILRNAEAAEILLSTPSPDLVELRAIIADIHKDDQRAGDVIERLRALLKRRQMQFSPLSIETLVKDANTLLRADAAARHVALECCAGDTLPMVAGDRVHLSQVLINLILNGMDAINEATGSRRRITVAARNVENASVEIAVADSGTGIPADRLPRIFEPFYTTKANGMGMGLSVSRTIVEAHGGRLWAENDVEGGAIFRFTLPTLQGSAS